MVVAESSGLRRLATSDRQPSVRMIRLATVAGNDRDADVLWAGLQESPAQTQPKFFYDEQGCALFGAICQLEEYYPTRTEARIFAEHRSSIAAALPENAQWVDLGCGDARKSRDWLPDVSVRRYVGVDIAEESLAQATLRVVQDLPDLEVLGVIADLARPFSLQPLLSERPGWPPIFFYPGSSIGNFGPAATRWLLQSIHRQCGDHGCLLIGVDLVKERSILEAAYDDALGVTGAFNLNLLRVLNRRLGANFDLHQFRHRAWFNEAESRIEMHLVSAQDQVVEFTHPQPARRRFRAGEHIITEHSYKYSIPAFTALLKEVGFSQPQVFTDHAEQFAVFLAPA